MKKMLHRILTLLGVVTWGAGNFGYALAIAFTTAADKLIPDTEVGNCWSYALPKWYKHGGYLLIRRADYIKFMNFFLVPHVAWVEKLPSRGVVLSQFVPNERTPGQMKTRWWPWFIIFYRGKVRNIESPHPSDRVKTRQVIAKTDREE